MGKKAFKSDWGVIHYVHSKEKLLVELPNWFRSERIRTVLTFWIQGMLEPEYQNRPSISEAASALASLTMCCASTTASTSANCEIGKNLDDPKLLYEKEYMIGSDMYTIEGNVDWEDVFVPGTFRQHELAVRRYENVFNTRRKVFGGDHLCTLWSSIFFARACVLFRGNPDPNYPLEDIILTTQRLLGTEHPGALSVEVMFSPYVQRQYTLERNIWLWTSLRNIRGEGHPDALVAAERVAGWLYRARRHREAEWHLKEAIKIGGKV